MRTVRSKTLANAMDQKTRSNRALGKQNREQLSEESRFQKSREIAENLMATAVWKQAKQVLLYASYGSEVSTGLLMDAALAAGKEAGGYDSVDEAAERMGNLQDKTYFPNAENKKEYDRLYREYELVHDYFGRGQNDVMKRLKKRMNQCIQETEEK